MKWSIKQWQDERRKANWKGKGRRMSCEQMRIQSLLWNTDKCNQKEEGKKRGRNTMNGWLEGPKMLLGGGDANQPSSSTPTSTLDITVYHSLVPFVVPKSN